MDLSWEKTKTELTPPSSRFSIGLAVVESMAVMRIIRKAIKFILTAVMFKFSVILSRLWVVCTECAHSTIETASVAQLQQVIEVDRWVFTA